MFCKKTNLPKIAFIRGNKYTYTPTLTYNEQPLETLGENQFLLFIVKSYAGNTYLSKTLTGTADGTPIVFEFLPTDTIGLESHKYLYSIDLYSDKYKEDFMTVEHGDFCLLPAIGTINDIETE